MKKGIEYSHYCGTELMDLISSIKLCMKLVDTDRTESKKWGEHAIKTVQSLRDKIAELDKLNDMNY